MIEREKINLKTYLSYKMLERMYQSFKKHALILPPARLFFNYEMYFQIVMYHSFEMQPLN